MCRRFSVDLLDLFISKRHNATATERYQYATSVDINNTSYKRIQSLIQNHRGFQARSKDQEILEEGGGAGPSTLPRRDHE